MNSMVESMEEIIGTCDENQEGDGLSFIWHDLDGNLISLENLSIPSCSKYMNSISI